MTDLLIQKTRFTTTLTLNRPATRNALAPSLVEALISAIQAASLDGTRLLVLRGEGKLFCAGFDLSDLDTCSEGDLLWRIVRIEQLLQAVYFAPFDTLALVQGTAVGAGAELLAACTHRVAENTVNFKFPGAGFGLVLGTRRLADRLGTQASLVLAHSGNPAGLGASEALQCGLLTDICPQDGWTDYQAALEGQIGSIAHVTRLALLNQIARGQRSSEAAERDLAALVSSACAPGLKARVMAYVARAKLKPG
jgi:enoyl-CoA hydratase/carnithine racemase